MRILAIDIGAGTQDILLYDDAKNIENCIKMVLPSPHLIFAEKIKAATLRKQDVFVNGDIIGGGAFAAALRTHVEKGFRAFMTETAAYTIRNNLDQVRSMGIEITNSLPQNFTGQSLTIKELDLKWLELFLLSFNERLIDVDIISVAVQDHGVSPISISNRKFRIQKMRERLEDNARPENLAFTEREIPSYFLRMKSAAHTLKKQLPKCEVLVMDTSPAAILGCLEDPMVKETDLVLATNVGNGHTMAAIIKEHKIIGIVEHHTNMLTPQKMEHLLIQFANGRLSNEEVFKDNGHGLFYLDNPPNFSQIKKFVATGPNRSILAGTALPVYFVAPAGDVMMTGPIGLVEVAKKKFKL